MKLLPEVPTEEIPDVKDEPVAYARTFNGEIMVDGLTLFADTADGELRQMNAEFPDDADKRKVISLYAHPSPRIAALEAEVVKLQAQLAKARSDAASPIYSADVLEKCAKPEGGFTDRDRKMHQHGFYCGVEEASESIRAAKDKP